MKKFNKLLNSSPTGGLSKTVQKRLDKCNYSIQSIKEFSQVVTIYQTLKKYHFIKTFTFTISSEDYLLTDILRQCDHNAMWDNEQIIKQLVTRIKFFREKCNI
jgi:hypothetical protein